MAEAKRIRTGLMFEDGLYWVIQRVDDDPPKQIAGPYLVEADAEAEAQRQAALVRAALTDAGATIIDGTDRGTPWRPA